MPLRAPNQLCSLKIHPGAYSNTELKRHRDDKKKKSTKNPIPVCECLVLKVQVMAQALQNFSSPHFDFEHFPEYNNLFYLKNITALQRQANSMRPRVLLKAGVPGIPWQHQSSSIRNLKDRGPKFHFYSFGAVLDGNCVIRGKCCSLASFSEC